MKFIELMTEVFGWLQIVASPFFVALGIGFIIYFAKPDTIGISIAIIITVFGLLVGIVLANRIWKKYGTMNYLSRINASPELDNKQNDDVNISSPELKN